MAPAKDDYVPILKTKKDISEEAKERINQERSGKQLGLKTRWSKLNIAVGKFFRFKMVFAIVGLSGHGKSALLNMILADFLNPRLNKDFKEPVVIIHNSFEMSPVDEVLRNVSSKLEKSHLYLLSSEFQEEGKYNTIDDFEFNSISQALEEDEDLNHYYFEEPTNTMGLMKNIICGIDYYKDKIIAQEHDISHLDVVELQQLRLEIPNPKVVVAIDHTLLVNQDKGDTVIDSMSKIAKLAIFLKKRGYMVALIGQLNGEIERPERLKNPDMHFPIKSDIYAQAQIYNACDIVLVGHQPELLGILEYGKNKLQTADLFHLLVLKQRFGKVGSIWLKNAFSQGKLLDFTPISNLKK